MHGLCIGVIIIMSHMCGMKYLTCNFDYPELEQFKVIQRQRSRCQSTAHGRLPIVVSVTVFEIFDIKAIFHTMQA